MGGPFQYHETEVIFARLVGHPISIPLHRIVGHSLTQAEATDQQASPKIDLHLPLSIRPGSSLTPLKILEF